MAETRVNRDVASKTLAKGLALLESVALAQEQGGATLTEISSRLGWNVSTTYRLLMTLLDCRYIERDPLTERYRLGAKPLELAAAFLRGLELRTQASPHLNELMLKTGLTTHLVILEEDSGDVVYIDKVDGPQLVRMYTYVGIRFPANCTASGKAILAHLSNERIERLIARGLRGRTAHSISSPVKLRRELARIRELGYATDKEENVEAINCVAGPVFDHTGAVIGAVSLSGSVSHIAIEEFPDYGAMVKATATAVSSSMGYRSSRD